MKRILLLDDSPTIQRVVTMSFTADKGYEVKAASNPAAAEEILKTFSPSIVVAYVRFMGEPDPSRFQGLAAAVPGMLLLAESTEPLEAFQNAGFKHFLRKPFHTEELKKNIEAVLEQSVPVQGVVNVSLSDAPKSEPPSEKEGTAATEVTPPPPPPLRNMQKAVQSEEGTGAGVMKPPPPPPVRRASPPPSPPVSSMSVDAPQSSVRTQVQDAPATSTAMPLPSAPSAPPRKAALSSPTPVPPAPKVKEVERRTNSSFGSFGESEGEAYKPSGDAQFLSFSGQPLPENRPMTTLDTEALERAYRRTMQLERPGMESDIGNIPISSFATPPPQTFHGSSKGTGHSPTLGGLSETSRDEIARIVRDVLEKELAQIKQASTSAIKAEAVQEVQEWLAREFVGIAKQVLREEIRKLLGDL